MDNYVPYADDLLGYLIYHKVFILAAGFEGSQMFIVAYMFISNFIIANLFIGAICQVITKQKKYIISIEHR